MNQNARIANVHAGIVRIFLFKHSYSFSAGPLNNSTLEAN